MIYILKENLNNKNRYLMKVYTVTKWFPIIQMFLFIPSTINRIIAIFDKQPKFALQIVQSILDYSEGIFILIIFILIPDMNNSILICIKKIFKKQTDVTEYDYTSEIQNKSSYPKDNTTLINYNESLINGTTAQ